MALKRQKNQEKSPEKAPTLIRILPNAVTLLGLCIGLSAIRFAIDGAWVKATTFLLIAGFLDGVDGRLARFLNSTSEFGAQLDSLVDFVNFGIVPGFIIYMWINQYGNIVGFDWALVMFFAIAMAIRLARFNSNMDKKEENKIIEKYFFTGIPAPCGAALAMLPMVLTYECGSDYFFTNPKFVIIYTVVLALFVASTVPTISIKKIPLRNEYVYPTLLFFGLLAIGLVVKPWITLALIGLIYIASIPITVIAYLRVKRNFK